MSPGSPCGEVRGQFCGSVLSFHIYLDFRDRTQVSFLALEVLLPTETSCWPQWNTLDTSHTSSPRIILASSEQQAVIITILQMEELRLRLSQGQIVKLYRQIMSRFF